MLNFFIGFAFFEAADTHVNGDLLGADGAVGIIIHRLFSSCLQKKKTPSGLSLRYKSAFILPLLFALPLIQQLDDGVLHLFRGEAAREILPWWTRKKSLLTLR